VLHLGQARHLLGALGTLLLSAALRPPSPPSPVCDEASRAQEACRCPSAQTHRDAPGRARGRRLHVAIVEVGQPRIEASGISGLGRSVWQRALRALQVVSLRSEALSGSHRPISCASEIARDVGGPGNDTGHSTQRVEGG
jgi:hypothetical protein